MCPEFLIYSRPSKPTGIPVINIHVHELFMELFQRNKHPHPLVYMRGVSGDDLMTMVEFLYSGEANVDQSNLDVFLALLMTSD